MLQHEILNHCKIPDKACLLLGNGFGDRFGIRISLLLVLIGSAGIYVEITNAFEYVQGARNGLKAEKQSLGFYSYWNLFMKRAPEISTIFES